MYLHRFCRWIGLGFAGLGVVGALGVSGCGFRPIYAERTGVNADFGAVQVATGEGRAAYLVRQAVIDTLGAERPGVDPKYNLLINVRENRTGFGLRVNDVATRYELSLSANYRLVERASGQEIAAGTALAAASYDVFDDVYSDIAVEENAKERAAELLAERLEWELAIGFLGDGSRLGGAKSAGPGSSSGSGAVSGSGSISESGSSSGPSSGPASRPTIVE